MYICIHMCVCIYMYVCVCVCIYIVWGGRGNVALVQFNPQNMVFILTINSQAFHLRNPFFLPGIYGKNKHSLGNPDLDN